MKVRAENHPQFSNYKCIIIDDLPGYAYFGQARHFMKLADGFKHSGCLSKFYVVEAKERAKELRARDFDSMPEAETPTSIRAYFGHTDNLFA